MSGSSLDVMCALFLSQWSELKAQEKPIQSLLPAGLRLVPTAWACRRSPSPRTRAVSLFQTLLQPLKEEHPAVEDKTAKSPWHLTASSRAAERGVWRSTDGADGPKQEHDADPVTGCPPRRASAAGDRVWRTPSRRRSGGHLAVEALAGEGRRAGAARGLLGDHSNELCRGEVRCGESSSATPCAFPRLSHWEVFVVPLDVVDSSRSKGCWVCDYPFMICGKKNDRVMYQLRLLFEMEKVKKLTEKE
ncbi:hypothetical protein WA556_006554 [Blastocystis sp. ATCC 50177/Nand II]